MSTLKVADNDSKRRCCDQDAALQLTSQYHARVLRLQLLAYWRYPATALAVSWRSYLLTL